MPNLDAVTKWRIERLKEANSIIKAVVKTEPKPPFHDGLDLVLAMTFIDRVIENLRKGKEDDED